MKVHYQKLYNMTHLLALNVLLLPKDLTIIFIQYLKLDYVELISSQRICINISKAECPIELCPLTLVDKQVVQR